MNISKLENMHGIFSNNMNCPIINDKNNPTFCIMIPAFKRNYFSESFLSFSKQTYKPKFYVIIQNDNRIQLNITDIRNKVDVPIYHIWMKNWNSLFFLIHRFASIFPCDFVLKYDDDQWPIDINLHKKLINHIKNENIIIGGRGLRIRKTICRYFPKINNSIENDIVDHCTTPFLIRPSYFKIDARNKIYRIFDAEDVHLSLNCRKLCNVTSKIIKMNLIERQRDGNHHDTEQIFIKLKKKERNVFRNTYCYLIRSGYIPVKWKEFEIPKNRYINTIISHKSLYL